MIEVSFCWIQTLRMARYVEIYFDEWKTLGGVKFEFRAVIRSTLASLVLYRQTYVLFLVEWPVLVGSFEFDIWKSKTNKNVYKHRQPKSEAGKWKNFQFFVWKRYSIKITSVKIVKVSLMYLFFNHLWLKDVFLFVKLHQILIFLVFLFHNLLNTLHNKDRNRYMYYYNTFQLWKILSFCRNFLV